MRSWRSPPAAFLSLTVMRGFVASAERERPNPAPAGDRQFETSGHLTQTAQSFFFISVLMTVQRSDGAGLIERRRDAAERHQAKDSGCLSSTPSVWIEFRPSGERNASKPQRDFSTERGRESGNQQTRGGRERGERGRTEGCGVITES